MNRLYFICPTDQLEPLINERFDGEKYFYTSLGNCLLLDKCALYRLACFIEAYAISEVLFVLSEDNGIIRDAVSDQKFFDVIGLKASLSHLKGHREQAENVWRFVNQNTVTLSYHLNEKMKELEAGLQEVLPTVPRISGKLLSENRKHLREVLPELLCMQLENLN